MFKSRCAWPNPPIARACKIAEPQVWENLRTLGFVQHQPGTMSGCEYTESVEYRLERIKCLIPVMMPSGSHRFSIYWTHEFTNILLLNRMLRLYTEWIFSQSPPRGTYTTLTRTLQQNFTMRGYLCSSCSTPTNPTGFRFSSSTNILSASQLSGFR